MLCQHYVRRGVTVQILVPVGFSTHTYTEISRHRHPNSDVQVATCSVGPIESIAPRVRERQNTACLNIQISFIRRSPSPTPHRFLLSLSLSPSSLSPPSSVHVVKVKNCIRLYQATWKGGDRSNKLSSYVCKHRALESRPTDRWHPLEIWRILLLPVFSCHVRNSSRLFESTVILLHSSDKLSISNVRLPRRRRTKKEDNMRRRRRRRGVESLNHPNNVLAYLLV